tara:strand:- start:11883 stop:12776 length:894 start_codon:yes stop_codon:yes gene_type:complete
MNPLISIVLPTYNHAKLIGNAIKSIINQSYKKWELIIIDNNSTDNTSKVISEFKSDKIKVFKINNNGVIATSRNFGIKKSTGEWIAFIDSDDIWYSNKLSIVVSFITIHKDHHVFCHDEIMNNLKTKTKKKLFYGPSTKNLYSTMLKYGNKLSTSSTVISKNYIESKNLLFREDLNLITVEDYDFWLLLARSNANFYFIKKFLGEYRIHDSNMSVININFFDNLLFLIRDHVFKKQNFENKKNRLFALIYLRIMISKSFSLFKNKKFFAFVNQIILLIKIAPRILFSFIFNSKNRFN